MTTIERARLYLASCPPAISGSSGHNATFTVATALVHGFSLPRSDALTLLTEFNLRCTPPWSERELIHKVDQAEKTTHDKPRSHLMASNFTPASSVKSCVSPSGKFVINRFQNVTISTAKETGFDATKKFLTTIFAPDDWICITNDATYDLEHDKYNPASNGTFMPLSRWLTFFPDQMWTNTNQGAWIRINPTKPDLFTGSDKNVSAYRHVLIEFDSRPKAEQIDIITRCQLPVSAVIDSGGKSVHAWVRVDATDAGEWEQRRDAVYDYLADVAPDPKNKNPSRFSRLPGIMRGGAEQTLIALNIGQPTWQEWIDWRDQNELAEPTKPSDLIAYNTDNDPNNVLGNRWLCRGGSMTIVGQSGVGKSSFAMQLGLTIALGKPFFGIKPIRPLRVAMVQAENDTGDMAEALKGVIAGMRLGGADIVTLDENVRFFDETVKTGSEFIKLARSIITKHRADVIIVDPLLSYAGDDISEQSFMSSFLRNQLNPVLQETGCCWVWLHHMPKPHKGEQAKGTTSDLAYAGAGSADLTNWSREVAVLQRESDEQVYSFTLTKRGKRSGMIDAMGNPTSVARLRHSTTGICWEYAPPAMFTARPIK